MQHFYIFSLTFTYINCNCPGSVWKEYLRKAKEEQHKSCHDVWQKQRWYKEKQGTIPNLLENSFSLCVNTKENFFILIWLRRPKSSKEQSKHKGNTTLSPPPPKKLYVCYESFTHKKCTLIPKQLCRIHIRLILATVHLNLQNIRNKIIIKSRNQKSNDAVTNLELKHFKSISWNILGLFFCILMETNAIQIALWQTINKNLVRL